VTRFSVGDRVFGYSPGFGTPRRGPEEAACATRMAATGDPPSVRTNNSESATTVLFATRDTALAARRAT
jgi:hypothetical protein